MPESGGQSEYLFLLIHLVVILAFAAFILVLSHFLGNRKVEKEKMSPYECGMRPIGTPRQRYSMQFYVIALLFILTITASSTPFRATNFISTVEAITIATTTPLSVRVITCTINTSLVWLIVRMLDGL